MLKAFSLQALLTNLFADNCKKLESMPNIEIEMVEDGSAYSKSFYFEASSRSHIRQILSFSRQQSGLCF